MIEIAAKENSDLQGNKSSPVSDTLLDLRNLSVSYDMSGHRVQAVRNVSIELKRGEVVALVGESGSGKSTIGHALMGLLRYENNVLVSGFAKLRCKDGLTRDLLSVSDREMRRLRGNDISIVFQEPMSSLNPLLSIGQQVVEAILAHRKMRRHEARERVLYFLRRLGIPNPEQCLARHPYQLSGGMRQRIMIAMALCCDASLLIADEATTALDATVQAQIIELLQSLQAETGMAILFITHDLGIVAEMANRAIVLYAGQVVEMAQARELFDNPHMPYTSALIDAIPRLGSSQMTGYELRGIPGRAPSAFEKVKGCSFHPRCTYTTTECRSTAPELETLGCGRIVRCLRWKELQQGGINEFAAARR